MNICIRGLTAFKKGCPESNICPAWIEKVIVTAAGEKNIVKQCLDFWFFKFLWDQNGLLEGNQQAIETFRNGMLETRNGKDYPKPDIGTVALLSFLKGIKDRQLQET